MAPTRSLRHRNRRQWQQRQACGWSTAGTWEYVARCDWSPTSSRVRRAAGELQGEWEELEWLDRRWEQRWLQRGTRRPFVRRPDGPLNVVDPVSEDVASPALSHRTTRSCALDDSNRAQFQMKVKRWNGADSYISKFMPTHCLFSRKKAQERIRGSGAHYHVCVAYACISHITYTTRKGAGTAFPSLKSTEFTNFTIIKKIHGLQVRILYVCINISHAHRHSLTGHQYNISRPIIGLHE